MGQGRRKNSFRKRKPVCMRGANRKLTRAEWGNYLGLLISNGGNVTRRFKPQMYSSHCQKIFIAFLLLFTTKSAAIGKKTNLTNCFDSVTDLLINAGNEHCCFYVMVHNFLIKSYAPFVNTFDNPAAKTRAHARGSIMTDFPSEKTPCVDFRTLIS